MRRREKNRKNNPPGDLRARVGSKEETKKDLEEISSMIFKNALARRLCERIMTDGLMTSVFDWYPDLDRIERVLSEMDSLLRRVQNGHTAYYEALCDAESGTEVRVGEAHGDRNRDESGAGLGPAEPVRD